MSVPLLYFKIEAYSTQFYFLDNIILFTKFLIIVGLSLNFSMTYIFIIITLAYYYLIFLFIGKVQLYLFKCVFIYMIGNKYILNNINLIFGYKL